jgi:transposase
MATVYLGVDIAKATFEAALWSGQGPQRLKSFPNTQAGFDQLAHALQQATEGLGPVRCHLVLEPTGGYELGLALWALEHGWEVSRPHPRHVRDFARGLGQRAKTDRIDALTLARYGAERQPSRWAPLPSEVSELESLLSRQRELEQMLGQEKRRQQALSGRPGVAAHVPKSHQQLIETLEQTLKGLAKEIKSHLKQHPHLKEAAKRLEQVPGVGKRNVLWLLVLLVKWETRTEGAGSAKSLVAFAGLDPSTHESGTSVRGRRSISRQGDRRLRALLYMSALGAIRGKNELRRFYQGLVGRGKAKKAALVAASRKILVWAWAVYRDQADFRPQACQAEAATAA